jgi:hypothetical protein
MSTMTGLESLATAAYNFHVGELKRLKERVNVLCAIVNAHPNCDDIYAVMPIVEGEISGHITIEGYRILEAYFTEALEARLEVAA